MTTSSDDVRTAVYRARDKQDRVLYIGVSSNPTRRSYAHRRKDWWADVERVDVTWFQSRSDALAEESRAIGEERPIYNYQHQLRNKGNLSIPASYTPLRNFRVEKELWEAAQAKAALLGVTLSDVIRDHLQQLVDRHKELVNADTVKSGEVNGQA